MFERGAGQGQVGVDGGGQDGHARAGALDGLAQVGVAGQRAVSLQVVVAVDGALVAHAHEPDQAAVGQLAQGAQVGAAVAVDSGQ